MIVQNKTLHIMGNDDFTLFPGVNDVKDEAWEKIKALKSIKLMIEEEELIEHDSRPLEKRTEKEANRLIKDTNNAALLKRWRTDDTRPGVQEAIAAQLAELTPTAEERLRASGG